MSASAGLVTCQADVDEGAAWLAAHAPGFADILAQTGQLPLRLRPDGFAGLADIIISQQVSVASAAAIRARAASAGFLDQTSVRAASDTDLRGVGLSRPKVGYLKALAEADVDYLALRQLPDSEVEARLKALKGVGPWTAQVYAMFAMGRRDVFPPGDLALQVAAAAAFDLPEKPTAQVLAGMAEGWSPWRSVAARALFAYYRVLKNREGLA